MNIEYTEHKTRIAKKHEVCLNSLVTQEMQTKMPRTPVDADPSNKTASQTDTKCQRKWESKTSRKLFMGPQHVTIFRRTIWYFPIKQRICIPLIINTLQ